MLHRQILGFWLAAVCSVPLAADDVKVAVPADLVIAIRNLDAAEFAVREQAFQDLLKAGPAAIELLARTAREGSPEGAARSLELLNRLYAANRDDSFDATEAVLFELMKTGRTATRDRAARILDLGADHRLERAVAELTKMGGLVKASDPAGIFAAAANPNPRNRPPNNIFITRRWTGGDDGLKQLVRLYHLPRLRIYRTKKAPVTDDALDAIAAEMGNVDEIQVRGEGYLGISAQQPAQGCLVSSVAENSAAAKAGLREGDIILQFDGHDIGSFQELIELLNDKLPGDKVPVLYSRNREEKTVEVELTDWK